ncbi:MAG: hypothetical protein AB1497_07925 [Bacillota bacterium]
MTKEGIPVIGDVSDGNESDRAWNYQTMDALRRHLGDLKELVYVADSSLVTGPNLKKMDSEGIRLISRLPANYATDAALKEKAWDDGSWKEAGVLSKRKDAAYRISSHEGILNGIWCRFVVVHSSKLEQRKEKTFEKELLREEEV